MKLLSIYILAKIHKISFRQNILRYFLWSAFFTGMDAGLLILHIPYHYYVLLTIFILTPFHLYLCIRPVERKNIIMLLLEAFLVVVLLNGMAEVMNGIFRYHIPVIPLLFLAALCEEMLRSLWNRQKACLELIYEVELVAGQKNRRWTGYYDTGNQLMTKTNQPVHIVSSDVIQSLSLSPVGEITFDTISQKNNKTDLYLVDKMIIYENHEIYQEDYCMLALCQEIFRGKDYQIILNRDCKGKNYVKN